ncbi:hypothetical protein J2Z35_001750 [Acetoanaerobium pronyense]|uniref:Uncharacterized protein n=1 Tax=Acetoanaerobium pronyense TaxID=1482736 RepID=A0ABS4KJJ8_9FIRM|nr:hypothetical protein [Acetoanaerobium pronyense]MBP2027952.1 hypothetical protein [Acetoanaerobium pronyense]
MSKYLFDTETIEKDLVILLSIISSSKYNHQLLNKFVDKDLLTIHFTEGFIIQEKLISTSINLRMIDDKFKEKDKKIRLPYEIVGNFFINNRQYKLDLREACNKVIHGKKFVPKVEPKKEIQRFQYYLPIINLEGFHGSNYWTVELEIEKYVCNGLSLIKQYDEDWDISARQE